LSREWHFNSLGAPHFGGLWEAAVREAKRCSVKITGDSLFIFEENTTFLCKVEAVLYFRPMVPLSNDPSYFSTLTPRHFLMGGPMLLSPETKRLDIPINRLRRWKIIKF